MLKEINRDRAICERCGFVMNIPKSYARLCYDCSQQHEIMEPKKIVIEKNKKGDTMTKEIKNKHNLVEDKMEDEKPIFCNCGGTGKDHATDCPAVEDKYNNENSKKYHMWKKK